MPSQPNLHHHPPSHAGPRISAHVHTLRDTSMRRHIALVHTSFVLVDVLNSLLDRTIPEARRTHIVEHSILQDVLDAGGLTPAVTRRMLGYFMLASSPAPAWRTTF